MSTLVIRLRKRGRKHNPVYDIVVANKSTRNRGFIVKRLGFLNPNYNERFLFLDIFSLGDCLNKGIILNDSLVKYISKFIFI